jgi:hypothetical protein
LVWDVQPRRKKFAIWVPLSGPMGPACLKVPERLPQDEKSLPRSAHGVTVQMAKVVSGRCSLADKERFWPYATSVWDYVNRAMPFDQPGLLKPSEVYSVVAYVLNLNGIVAESQVLDAKSLPQVRMPNRDGFVEDPRPDVGDNARKPK